MCRIRVSNAVARPIEGCSRSERHTSSNRALGSGAASLASDHASLFRRPLYSLEGSWALGMHRCSIQRSRFLVRRIGPSDTG